MSTVAALKADGTQAAPLCVLMVEDDANDAELLQAHLAQARLGGARILHARTLTEGIALQKSHHVQITLLDLDLPDSQGLHTLERMRAAATGPVIVISGNSHPSLVDEALKRRAYDVIPKDALDAATLQRVLRLATRHREAGGEQGTSEGRYRALLESSSEALVLLDKKGRIQYASAAMRRVLGYNTAEILGRSGLGFVQREDRAAVQKAFLELSADPGAFVTLRARFQHRDGGQRVLESSLANRLADADVAAIVCSYRDVTQEEEHRERFNATFESAPVGLAHVDPEGRIQLINRRLCAMLGYAAEELIGRTVRELSHPEDIDSTAELRAQLRAGVIPQFTTRKRYLRKDGATLWVQLTVSLERDAQGLPKYDVAAFEDITDAVRAEERLRASESRLRAIVGAEPECVKLIDAEGTLLEMNPAGLAMIEAESLEVVAGQCVYALVAPAYRQRFKDLTDRVCRGERGSLEFEIVGLRGAHRWMETHAVPLRDEATGKTLLLGISRDITARKQAERAAERVRRMYEALSSANEAIGKIGEEQSLYRRICELLVEHGGLRLAAVRLVNRETASLEAVVHAGGPTSYLEKVHVCLDERRPEARGSAARAVREGRTMVDNDYLAEPALAPWHALAREAGIAATMCVPLRRAGETIGLLILYAAETGWFDAELVGLAERMAQNLSFALDNIDHERQRSAAQSAVRESEQRFRSLTELSSDWFWEQDAELRFTRFSGGQGEAKWGEDQERTLGRRRWEIPQLTPLSCSWEEHRAALEARKPFRGFEYARVCADGSRRYVSASGAPVFGTGGEFLGYHGTATDITERKLAESALRESEARFRSLVALSSDFYWETDAEHRITKREGGARASAQPTYGEGAGIGKRRWELPFLAPDMQGWMAHKAVLDAHQPFQDFELCRPTADGGARYFSITGEPVFDHEGSFRGYRGVGTDITVRKSALRTLELEHAVNRHLAAAESARVGVQAVLRAICELHNWEHGRFWQVDDEAGLMRFATLWSGESAAADSLAQALRDVVFHPGQGIAGRVWQSGEPIWVADASKDPRTAKHTLWRTPLRGTFMFPVKGAGRVLGVITIASGEIRKPDERLLAAAGAIGDQVGQFLLRKRNEEAMRRFRAGMDASADMVLLIDHKAMRYVDVNETACRTLGYSREEMLAMGPHDLLPMAREELQAAYEKFVADPATVQGMNSSYRCKDGSTIPFESTRRVLQTEGGALIVAISRDIRKRMQAEQALRDSEARFRSLTELSADWYWEQDAELRFVSTGGHDKERGGITAAQHDGLRRWELPGTEPLEGDWEEHKAQLAARQPFRDFMLRRKGNDGKLHYVSISGQPIFGEDGAFRGYRGVAKDVTQSMEAMLALGESEERFRSLIALSSDWYWEQDAEFRFTVLSGRGAAALANGDVSNYIGTTRWDTPDLEPVEGTWEEHRAMLERHEPFQDVVLRRRLDNGRDGYMSVSGEPTFDEHGRFTGYRGVAKDVTAAKLAEGELRRFRTALDISVDAISLVDADTLRIIDVNDAALRNLGYSRHELLGQPVWSVFPNRSAEDVRATYDRLLQSADGSELEQMRHRRKDGSIVPVEVTRRVLRTGEGTYIIGIARDMTERLRSEERLRSSHERFEIVSRATNDVVWDWNLLTDQIWWNDNFQKLFGYEPREIGAYADSWRSRIHPEDAPRVRSQIDTAIRGGAKAWTGEYRFLCKDGTYVDVLDRGLLMHDERGQPVRMIGAMMDVSERKHAERHMRVHAERQAAIARFGQFALGRRSVEELYTEAARALRWEGVDAVCVTELHADLKEYVVRAAQGDGPHATIGQRGPIVPESVWPEIMRENSSRIAGRRYLQSVPAEHPWRDWLRTMGSAIYVPVRDDDKPMAMLCMLAREENVFGAADVRFGEAVANILTTALQRQKAEQRLAHLAQFDALTGLPNRTLLQDRLAQTIVQSRRKRWHAGALFVDLDRFKLINDTLGHYQGDALIRQVGERLLECIRPGDTVGRISGDEFAVVLADMARPDDAALVAQKVLDTLARPFNLGGNEAYISASIGIATFPGDGEDAETLLKNADIAMYRAKESARNCYRFFTAEMNQRTVAKVQMNTDLRRAIERGEFELYYQPKVDLADGQPRGLEALLRWNHPQRGMVSPGEFIPALEDSGLIMPVGEWVIGEACAQLRRWREQGRVPLPLAVNLSPKQFRRGDLDRIIRTLLGREAVDAGLLELEITESCLMEDPQDAVRVMHNLRAAGLRMSIDDFGTGYSSLSYLTRLPLSSLKVDRSFVRDAGASAEAASIVRAVIDMAQNLRFTVIAEGVETEQQVAFLRQHGCNQAQGYFFGRPAPAADTGELLARA